MKRKNIFSALLSLLLVVSIFTTMAMESYQAKGYSKTPLENVPKKVISIIKELYYSEELKDEDIEVYFYKPLKKDLALINYDVTKVANICNGMVYTETIGDYIYCVPSCSDMVDIMDFGQRETYDIAECYEKGKINDKDLKKISKLLADYPQAYFVKPKLSAAKKTLKKGESFKLKVEFPQYVFCPVEKWSSSNKKVAKVNQKGKVTALKKGKATITAKLENGKKLKCKITVKGKINVKKPRLNYKKVSISSCLPRVKLRYIGGTGKISWKSSNPKVATVNKNGLVKMKKAGTTIITAKRNGIALKCKVKCSDTLVKKSVKP